jgi:hypothetical protein
MYYIGDFNLVFDFFKEVDFILDKGIFVMSMLFLWVSSYLDLE